MQLVAYGAQDVFLTGKPEISFFKVVYRRHTNFAMESIEQTFNGNPALGNRVTCTISRNGDLITNMWLECELKPTGTAGNLVNSVGHALIEYVELEIGGQRIDKHYGEWLEIWSELTLPEEKKAGFDEMIARRDMTGKSPKTMELYIPMQFFFCRNPGLALPLIALQYHEVKINLKFRPPSDLIADGYSDVSFKTTPKLYVDYVYLDTDERRRFATGAHEYLIEQLQHTGPETSKNGSAGNYRLNFNHPVKELVWVTRESGKEVLAFGNVASDNSISDAFGTCKLQLNGHDRFSERKASYFRLVQPYQHHTRIPTKEVFCYSFALNPEAHQPSGTCNFSRLDNVTLTLSDMKGDGEVLVYAVSNNILKIMSGMGGLAYSN
jgi:hypothetical protein